MRGSSSTPTSLCGPTFLPGDSTRAGRPGLASRRRHVDDSLPRTPPREALPADLARFARAAQGMAQAAAQFSAAAPAFERRRLDEDGVDRRGHNRLYGAQGAFARRHGTQVRVRPGSASPALGRALSTSGRSGGAGLDEPAVQSRCCGRRKGGLDPGWYTREGALRRLGEAAGPQEPDRAFRGPDVDPRSGWTLPFSKSRVTVAGPCDNLGYRSPRGASRAGPSRGRVFGIATPRGTLPGRPSPPLGVTLSLTTGRPHDDAAEARALSAIGDFAPSQSSPAPRHHQPRARRAA